MKKADFKKKKVQLTNGSDVTRQTSFTKGDDIRLTLKEDLVTSQNTNGNVWDGVNTDDGLVISTSQLIRRGNGLALTGKTNQERFDSFIDLFTEDEEGNSTLHLTVDKVKETHTLFSGVEGISRQLVFHVV